jgi:hypothetical protein
MPRQLVAKSNKHTIGGKQHPRANQSVMSSSKSLKAQILDRKRSKRERIQDDRMTVGARGRGSHRQFRFRPLPFESDEALFNLNGGKVARQQLIQGYYEGTGGNRQPCLHLYAPEKFTLNTNLDGVLRFVYEMRRQVFIDRRFLNPASGIVPIYLNLDAIREIDLRGALILAAEFDRIRTVLGFKPILDDHHWDPTIRATLHALGLHEITQAYRRDKSVAIRSSEISENFQSDRFQIIKMRSGVGSSNVLAKEMRDELFEACRPFSSARPQIYNVLVEAFNNSREHAYPDGSGEDGIPSMRGWWAGAIVDHHLGVFQLAVFDQGIGIPERFSRQHDVSRRERQQAGGSGDMLVIQRAAQQGITSTQRPGRGNGLWQMTDLTRTLSGSHVEFMSLAGSVTYRSGIASGCFIPPQRFCGTMITWHVPFKPRLEIRQ